MAGIHAAADPILTDAASDATAWITDNGVVLAGVVVSFALLGLVLRKTRSAFRG